MQLYDEVVVEGTDLYDGKVVSDELAQRCRALEENMKRIQAEIAEAAIRSGAQARGYYALGRNKDGPGRGHQLWN